MKLKVEMTLTDETAQKLKETGERLAVLNLGDDGLLAAAVLMRIAANYERARKEAGEFAPENGEQQGEPGGSIPVEQLNAENDE
jgi:hypothetical protein